MVNMIVGFVLIVTMTAKEHDVYTELLKVKETTEVHPLFGEYDLIARIEAKCFDELGEIVLNKIRKVEGVADTKTLAGSKF